MMAQSVGLNLSGQAKQQSVPLAGDASGAPDIEFGTKMTTLGDLLAPGAVNAALSVANKKALFQSVGAVAEREYGLVASDVAERLTERERLGSTGFGNGIAIPHGRVEGLKHIVAIFCRLNHPIDFDAIDALPVDMIFCLLSPPDAGADHLKALAQASRWLRDASFVANLRGAGSDDAVFALFSAREARNAA
jgi:nitrogen PTS system EIIA component